MSKKKQTFNNSIENYYTTLPKKFINKTHTPNYDSHLLNLPCRAIVIGPSGSGLAFI